MMRTFLAVAVVSPLLSLTTAAWAQSYPNRPVRVVVPAATGGPDIVARVVGAQLQAQLGQPFVIENRPGANGIVGADVVAKAPPDGYTLMVYSSGFVINPFVHKSLPYDTEKDFTPVTNLVSNGGLFLAVANSLPPKTLQEFIDYAKKSPAALASGEVQVMFASPAPLMPHYKSGRVRVLAFTSNRRHPAAPEVPTTAEA